MNKRGFTLIELVGVIILVAFISIISIPPILNQINRKKEEMKNAVTKTISSAAILYVDNNKKEFLNQKKSCVKISTLVDNNYLDNTIYSYDNYSIDLKEAYIKVGKINEEVEILINCTPDY